MQTLVSSQTPGRTLFGKYTNLFVLTLRLTECRVTDRLCYLRRLVLCSCYMITLQSYASSRAIRTCPRGFHFALKSLPSWTPRLELSFATFIAILGFNKYA